MAPAQLPEADASVFTLKGDGHCGHRPGVNHNTYLTKECLVTALRATAGIVEACPRKEVLAGGVQPTELLAGFLEAIEVSRIMKWN